MLQPYPWESLGFLVTPSKQAENSSSAFALKAESPHQLSHPPTHNSKKSCHCCHHCLLPHCCHYVWNCRRLGRKEWSHHVQQRNWWNDKAFADSFDTDLMIQKFLLQRPLSSLRNTQNTMHAVHQATHQTVKTETLLLNLYILCSRVNMMPHITWVQQTIDRNLQLNFNNICQSWAQMSLIQTNAKVPGSPLMNRLKSSL